jgi:hypothetical protein
MQQMNSDDILAQSREFYNAHHLQTFADNLPASLDLSVNQIAEVEAQGFDRAIVLPPVAVQRAEIDRMIQHLLTEPAGNLPLHEQYNTPWIHDLEELRHSDVHHRPDEAYVLFYRSQPYPDETCDLTGPKLQALFRERGWRFLTIFEYMVLQRIFAEAYGDHRFDHYADNAAGKAGWGWVLDSSAGDRCFHTYWNPNKGQGSVHFGYCKPSNKNPRRGAHPVKLVSV